MNSLVRFIERFIEWIHAHLDKKQFLILSSILVGLTAGLAAIILKSVVHAIQSLIMRDYGLQYPYLVWSFTPLVGLVLTVAYVKYMHGGKLGRGVANILHAIAKKSSKLPFDQMYSHLATSMLTVGFGGSAGLESPIVTTGSAIGSNYGKTYHLTYKDRTMLLACGAAAGIAAAFNAPIAGMLFALEVLLSEVAISAFIPLMIAAATGALFSKIMLGNDILLSFPQQIKFNYHNIPGYIVLGLLTGLFAAYYSRVFPRAKNFFAKSSKNIWWGAIGAGLFLAVLIMLFPSLFGEGYAGIKSLAAGEPGNLLKHGVLQMLATRPVILLIIVIVILLLKPFATAATIGGGGNGGNFAPALFAGGYLGFIFSNGLNILGLTTLPVANFTIVGMSGVLTGIFHAPLTGIFLIAEITGGYELMIPLMIVSALSYVVTRYFEPNSMEAKALAKKGVIYSQDKDKNILGMLQVEKIVETDFQQVLPTASLGELVDVVELSHRNIFPVVDGDGVLVGVILLDDIRTVMFHPEKYDVVTVSQLMRAPAAVVEPEENMIAVMKKFDETGAWNLPVTAQGLYKGFISKSSILTRYRSQLKRNAVQS